MECENNNNMLKNKQQIFLCENCTSTFMTHWSVATGRKCSNITNNSSFKLNSSLAHS
jgi:hypothetical protein